MVAIAKNFPPAGSQQSKIGRETRSHPTKKAHSTLIEHDTFEKRPETRPHLTVPKPRLGQAEATQKVQAKKIARMNAQVTIENIHSRSTLTNGETKLIGPIPNSSPIPRIMETIRDLGKLT